MKQRSSSRPAVTLKGSSDRKKTGQSGARAGRLLTRKLASPGDPYVTEDGRIIEPEGVMVDVDAEYFQLRSSNFKPTKRRSIKELPADVPMMKAIACVFVFVTMGMSNREISEALGISMEQVAEVREHKAFGETFDAIVGEFINSNSTYMASRIAAYGHDALTEVANIAFNGKKEDNRLRGSVHLMDMGGHSAKIKDRVDMSTSELHIVISEGGPTKVDVHIGGEAF